MIFLLPFIYLLEQKLFFGLICTIIAAIFLYNFQISSDYYSYQEFFQLSCNGKFVGVIEPGYQILSYIFGIIFSIECDLNDFRIFNALAALLTVPTILALINIQYHFYDKLNKSFVAIVAAQITLYLIVLVFGYNFRSGFAVIFAIFGFNAMLEGQKVRCIIYLLLSVAFHVQVFPFILIITFITIARHKWLMLIFSLLVIVSTDFLFEYIWSQGWNYLRNAAFTIRITALPWLVLDFGIILLILGKNDIEGKRLILIFTICHLIINLVFLQNSHISGRVSKAFEPILLCSANVIIYRSFKQRYVSVFVCTIPITLVVLAVLLTDGYFYG